MGDGRLQLAPQPNLFGPPHRNLDGGRGRETGAYEGDVQAGGP